MARIFEIRNDRIPYLIVMIGVSGSGKSTYAKEIQRNNTNVVIHSSDDLRAELFGDAEDQTHNAEVFDELYRRVALDLAARRNVIIDATNVGPRSRQRVFETIQGVECKTVGIFFRTPVEECLERNHKRTRRVPDDVIRRQHRYLCKPSRREGFDVVYTVNA